METQVGRKAPLTSSLSSIFYYTENILQQCTGADSYQHAGTHLQKATTFSHLPASPGRELQPPTLVCQPLLEGSYNPLTCLPASPRRELRPPTLVYQPHLEGSYNPLNEGYNPQHLYGPRFINFHTGSKASFRTPLAGHISSYFQTGPFPYF